MTIIAKFASQCPVCRTQIAAGTQVEWTKGARATHVKCAFITVPDRTSDVPSFQCEHGKSNHCTVRGNPIAPSSQYDIDDAAFDAWLAEQRERAMGALDRGLVTPAWYRPSDSERRGFRRGWSR